MPAFLRPQTLLSLVAALALSLPAAGQQADVRLPSLGSSADTMMSPQEADQYGAEFLRELRGAHLVMDDPQIDEYLHTLGYRLVSASADPGQHYTFTLINIPEINSFATFGGYIFIFSGMFTATRTQDELAAVMAHELAHVSQHHLQRAMEDQKKALPLYLIGTLAAAMAASRVDSNHPVVTSPYGYGYGNNVPYDNGGIDPVAGVIASGLGLIAQHQIDFTRADEAEADHVGIQTLAKAGFDPEAMANVFAHMQALMRPGGEGGMAAGNIPDFLQDHPVSSVRIADARARARVLEQQMQTIKACVSVQIDLPHCTEQQVRGQVGGKAADPSGHGMLPLPFVKDYSSLLDDSVRGPSERQYELMRERVRVLSSSNPRATLDYYAHNMAGGAKFAANPANRYGHALALVQLNEASRAVPIMAKLVEADPGNLTLALGLADAERRAGQRSEALQRYASLNARWPNDPAVVLDYSRTLLDDGSKASAKVAQDLLKPLLDDDSEPSLYAAYGHACHVAGDEVHAGIAYADASFLSGHAADALDQLHRLLDRKDLDYYTRSQINARIAQITPIVLEIRRRHLDPDRDDGNQLQGGDARSGLRFGACAGVRCPQD
ncbi:MAG TPA: M48 family metalloprotease [Rhodanobacteraceae bacterium]|nr:M48 family metalloprotease [Rhodanobacteraceae bacterium]